MRHLSILSRILIFCAGADERSIILCPKRVLFVTQCIGTAVLFTGIYATLAWSYIFSLVFDTPEVAIPLGVFGGLAIFNIDRFVVTSLDFVEDSPWAKFTQLFPRLLLATVVAVLIAPPLQMRLFRDEIKESLGQQLEDGREAIELNFTTKNKVANENLVKDLELMNRNPEFERLNRQIQTLQSSIDQCNSEAASRKKAFDEEVNGKGGTRKPGYGIHAKQREAELKKQLETCSQLNRELQTVFAQQSLLKESNESEGQTKRVKDRYESAVKNLEQDKRRQIRDLELRTSDRFLARFRALSHMMEDPSVRWMVSIIYLFFLIFEITPVILKTITVIPSYEKVAEFEQREFDREIQQEEEYREYSRTQHYSVRRTTVKLLYEEEETIDSIRESERSIIREKVTGVIESPKTQIKLDQSTLVIMAIMSTLQGICAFYLGWYLKGDAYDGIMLALTSLPVTQAFIIQVIRRK